MISFRLIRSCGKRRGSFFTALCFRRSRISFQTALQHSPENPVNSPCDFSVMQSTLPPSLFSHPKSNRKLYLFGFRSTKVPPAFLPFHCSCSKRRGSFFDADFARNCFSSRQPLTKLKKRFMPHGARLRRLPDVLEETPGQVPFFSTVNRALCPTATPANARIILTPSIPSKRIYVNFFR